MNWMASSTMIGDRSSPPVFHGGSIRRTGAEHRLGDLAEELHDGVARVGADPRDQGRRDDHVGVEVEEPADEADELEHYRRPSSRERSVARSTAPIRVRRMPPSSSAAMPAMVVPPGDATMSLSWPGMQARLEDEPGRAEHGLGRERHRGGAVEPHLDAAVGERLDHDGDVGRAGARQPGDGVQVLLVEHDDAPDGAEQRLGDLEVARLEALRARDGRRALEHERRRVRHDADQPRRACRGARAACASPRPAAIEIRSFVRRRRARSPRSTGAHDLGLDGEDDHVGLGDERGIVSRRRRCRTASPSARGDPTARRRRRSTPRAPAPPGSGP